MGIHTIHFTWNVVINKVHKIEVIRVGRMSSDTLEIILDGVTLASPTVNLLAGIGLFRGKTKFSIEDHIVEIYWKYSGFTFDPESIMLTIDNKIVACYGNSKAIKKKLSESIKPENLIPLVEPHEISNIDYSNWNPIRKWLSKFTLQFGSPALPPAFGRKESSIALDMLGREIGFQDETIISLLAINSKNLKKWHTRRNMIYFILVFPILIILWYLLFKYDINFYTDSSTFYLLYFPLAYILVFGLGTIVLRIALQLSRKYEIETLCVVTIIYMLIELKQDDALVHFEKKQILIARIRFLIKQTILLSKLYQNKNTNQSNIEKVQSHFKNIERYLEERENWIQIPVKSTLQDLRKDFFDLAIIYITGLYGEFSYKPIDEPSYTQKQAELPSILKNISQGFPKFMGSIILPTTLLLIFWEKLRGTEKLIGIIEPEFATLLLFTWLTIGIDTVLSLGIVANLVNTAKEIRDISK